MILAGIDYSMSCPAITVRDTIKHKNYYYYFATKLSLKGKKGHNIVGSVQDDYSCDEERFNNIAMWAITILKGHKVDKIGIEDYSFASKGQVYNIGENGGVLRHYMWLNGFKWVSPKPTQIKKFARECLPEAMQKVDGKLLKMDKEAMVKCFYYDTTINLCDVFNAKASASPLNDIADSYFIMKMVEKGIV